MKIDRFFEIYNSNCKHDANFMVLDHTAGMDVGYFFVGLYRYSNKFIYDYTVERANKPCFNEFVDEDECVDALIKQFSKELVACGFPEKYLKDNKSIKNNETENKNIQKANIVKDNYIIKK